jgi:hypothetical protein
MRENIKRVSGNGIGEIRDNGKAVLGIRDFVGGYINRLRGMRKTRGRFRT